MEKTRIFNPKPLQDISIKYKKKRMKKYIQLAILILVSGQLFAQKEIWGTVSNGGQFGNGYIFKTDSIGENLNIVHHFNSINGNNPGALLAASDNKLYGLTASGGNNNQGLFDSGVFYEYDLTTNTFTVLENFELGNTQIKGILPSGDGFRTLTEVSPGIIYGQIKTGIAVGSTIFKWNASTQSISTALILPTYQGGNTNQTLGNRLTGSLYLAPDGFLYGTTSTNSQCPIPNPNLGSIIRINPATNAFSIRHLAICNPINGAQFDNQFAIYDNTFYSVAQIGGANYKGVIYSFDPTTSTYTNKYNFEGGLLGDHPSTMVAASNGKFYGTANGGTPERYFPSGCGILYEFDPVNNSYSKKLDFTYGNGLYTNVGTFPSGLINGNNGKLYGVTANGLFEYNPISNENSAKGRFPIDMGWNPSATPSLTFVCRKPSYNFGNNTNYILCRGTDFSIDLNSENTTSVVWKHNGIIDPLQTSTILSLTDVDSDEIGSWKAELTNECGTTISETFQISLTSVVTVMQEDNLLEVISGGDSFQWFNCTTNTNILGAINQTFSFDESGSFAVVVTNGTCSDTSECYTVSVLSTNDNTSNNTISLYPNPVINVLNFPINTQFQSVVIYNVLGKEVMNTTMTDKQYINISDFPAGFYIIMLQTSKGILRDIFIKK